MVRQPPAGAEKAINPRRRDQINNRIDDRFRFQTAESDHVRLPLATRFLPTQPTGLNRAGLGALAETIIVCLSANAPGQRSASRQFRHRSWLDQRQVRFRFASAPIGFVERTSLWVRDSQPRCEILERHLFRRELPIHFFAHATWTSTAASRRDVGLDRNCETWA